jgi:hypothetical protein
MASYRRVLTEFNGKVKTYVAAIVLKFRPAWQSYAYAAIQGYEETMQKVNNGWEEMLESADDSWDQFVKKMDEKFDYISLKFEGYISKIKG